MCFCNIEVPLLGVFLSLNFYPCKIYYLGYYAWPIEVYFPTTKNKVDCMYLELHIPLIESRA